VKEDLVSFFGFEKLGEFSLVEGSFKHLFSCSLPRHFSGN